MLIRFADLAPEPWRNGAGVTRTVATGSGWRVSIADVASSGPFSSFPGLDRVIVLCDGQAMKLVIDGERHDLVRYQPFAFAGEAVTSGELESPTRDLNVMTERARCRAEITVGRPGDVGTGEGQTVIVVALQGSTRIGETILAPLDAVVLNSGDAAQFAGDGLMAVAVITEGA
jgi:hypothetical protein